MKSLTVAISLASKKAAKNRGKCSTISYYDNGKGFRSSKLFKIVEFQHLRASEDEAPLSQA